MKHALQILTAAAALAASLFAQGPKGPNPAAPATGQPAVNIAASATISGRIVSVQVTYGAQYPSITLDGKTIKIAPVWFLLEHDFELGAGEEVSALVAPSAKAGDPSLYAISVTKAASGATLIMRSENGAPLWTAHGNGSAPSPRRQNSGSCCVDPSTIALAQGVVDAITQGAGIQQPQLTLVSNGQAITVKVGPEKTLLSADFEIKAGMVLTVRYAGSTCTGELVALSLADEGGKQVVLRNDDGTPAWN